MFKTYHEHWHDIFAKNIFGQRGFEAVVPGGLGHEVGQVLCDFFLIGLVHLSNLFPEESRKDPN